MIIFECELELRAPKSTNVRAHLNCASTAAFSFVSFVCVFAELCSDTSTRNGGKHGNDDDGDGDGG